MSTANNEHALFKLCVEQPIRLSKDLNSLNLQFVNDPKRVINADQEGATNDQQLDSQHTPVNNLEARQRKAVRLYQMIWSGLTKYLSSNVHQYNKAVEIPGLAIIGPLVQQWQTLRDPLDKGNITKSTFDFKQSDATKTVIMALCDKFVSDADLVLEHRGEKAIASYNQQEREEIMTLFASQVAPLNTTKIASVCLTDGQTVDAMLGELFAQLASAAKSGIRLNFKVGSMVVKAGGHTSFHQQVRLANTGISFAATHRMHSDQLSEAMSGSKVSVMTPSIAKTVGKSMITQNMHVSNPNPQIEKSKQYRSVNQIGQDEPRNEAEKKMMQMLKFGRRVVFDKQMSNKDVLDNHLTSMHEVTQQRLKNANEAKRDDRDYIDKRKQQDDYREGEKRFYNSQLRKDYANHNKVEKANHELNDIQATRTKMAETSDYFPFVSGELLEEHRKVMNNQMRNEIQQYMTSTRKRQSDDQQSHHSGTGSRSALAEHTRQSWQHQQRNSCLSQSQTRFLHVQKVTPGIVRSLFDSVYLRPEENPRVINYSDPAKAHIMEDARKRQEQKKSEDSHRNNIIDSRIQSDADRDREIARQSMQVFRQHQRETHDNLISQSEAKKQLKTMEAVYDQTMQKTSFAPQETVRDYEGRMQIKRQNNVELQRNLQDMIDEKANQRRQTKDNKLADECEGIRQTEELRDAECFRKTQHRLIDHSSIQDQLRNTGLRKDLILL